MEAGAENNRTRWRTFIRVLGVEGEGDQKKVRAEVVNWRRRAISFPLGEFPPELHDLLTPERYLIAEVNLAARRGRQLKPRNFEVAPEPDEPVLP
jgi:hypothetical protein